jgi:hypothetical protein
MQKAKIQSKTMVNTKYEISNSKQIQSTDDQNSKQVLIFQFRYLDLFRIFCYGHKKTYQA